MSGKRWFTEVEKRLCRLGYEFSHHTNRGGVCVYRHVAAPEVSVSRGINEGAARQLFKAVDQHHGRAAKVGKRDVQAAKKRQAAEREKAKAENARLDAERKQILLERASLLGGAGAHLSDKQILELEGRVRQIERQQRDLVCLMTAPPVGSGPDGSVKHRAGQR